MFEWDRGLGFFFFSPARTVEIDLQDRYEKASETIEREFEKGSLCGMSACTSIVMLSLNVYFTPSFSLSIFNSRERDWVRWHVTECTFNWRDDMSWKKQDFLKQGTILETDIVLVYRAILL